MGLQLVAAVLDRAGKEHKPEWMRRRRLSRSFAATAPSPIPGTSAPQLGMQAQSVPCRARWRQRISGDTATGVTWMPKTLAENRKTGPVLSFNQQPWC